MSWKDLKISQKLYVGFGLVLALTVVIGYVGYNGLTTVTLRVQQADDANRLVKWVKDCSTLERDFFLSGDKKYVDQVGEILSKMDAQIDATKSTLKAQADKDGFENVRKSTADYRGKLNEFASLDRQSREASANMDNAARQAVEIAESSRSADIQRSMSAFQNCRIEAKNYLITGEEKYVAGFNSQIQEVERKAGGAERSFTAAVSAYETAFTTFAGRKRAQLAVGTQLQKAAEEAVTLCEDLRQVFKKKMQDAQASATTLTVIFMISAVLLGALVAYIISRAISRPITRVVGLTEKMNGEFAQFAEVVGAIANHDFTRDISQSRLESLGYDTRDEVGLLAKAIEGTLEAKHNIGESLKSMTESLTKMVRMIGDNANQLVSAATEIASSAEQMSRGAKNQADQIGQISTAVEEMSATIVETSKNSNSATDASKQAADTASSGGTIVADTVGGMQNISTVVSQSAGSIKKLAGSADQIGEIIGVIDDIADQTNLLALNAAIEAARAGEQGRGFAVVADEVRKLAERTGKATGEIASMIKGIQKETEEAVHSMETGIQEVDRGRELADKAGASLNEIVTMSKNVMMMISQIATASEQQSAAAEQISKNIEQISSIAKETATGTEQSAAAAEQLNRQANGLKEMVAQFKVK